MSEQLDLDELERIGNAISACGEEADLTNEQSDARAVFIFAAQNNWQAMIDMSRKYELMKDECERLKTAIRDFLNKANDTPPWESAGTIWADMLVRLNHAICEDEV